jgi:hypothetical protein
MSLPQLRGIKNLSVKKYWRTGTYRATLVLPPVYCGGLHTDSTGWNKLDQGGGSFTGQIKLTYKLLSLTKSTNTKKLFDAVVSKITMHSRGQILGRNPYKSLMSFSLCNSQSSLQLCLEISISSNSRNLWSSITVHCNGERRKA